MKQIASRDNPRLKTLRRWAASGRARREAGVLLLDGLHLIDALLDANGHLEEIIVSERGLGRPEIATWLERHRQTAVLKLPDRLFDELVATDTPSGILAVGHLPERIANPDPAADCILLDGVQDPGNVGTLLRTAAAAGIRQALLSPGCADAWSPKALRAGQGAQFLLTSHENRDLAAFLRSYRGTGVATRLDAAASLYDTPLSGPLAWVFGAEGRGVSEPVSAAVGCAVRIPMPGATESLNVAAAAAICLFEVVRRRSSA